MNENLKDILDRLFGVVMIIVSALIAFVISGSISWWILRTFPFDVAWTIFTYITLSCFGVLIITIIEPPFQTPHSTKHPGI